MNALPAASAWNLDAELDALDAAQARRRRRVVDAYDGVRLRVAGREMLAFCSNDYLGLAQHPALREAAREAAARWGVGATASPRPTSAGTMPRLAAKPA